MSLGSRRSRAPAASAIACFVALVFLEEAGLTFPPSALELQSCQKDLIRGDLGTCRSHYRYSCEL